MKRINRESYRMYRSLKLYHNAFLFVVESIRAACKNGRSTVFCIRKISSELHYHRHHQQSHKIGLTIDFIMLVHIIRVVRF